MHVKLANRTLHRFVVPIDTIQRPLRADLQPDTLRQLPPGAERQNLINGTGSDPIRRADLAWRLSRDRRQPAEKGQISLIAGEEPHLPETFRDRRGTYER